MNTPKYLHYYHSVTHFSLLFSYTYVRQKKREEVFWPPSAYTMKRERESLSYLPCTYLPV